MPKTPRITAQEAEKLLLKAGFEAIQQKGSHRVFIKGAERIVIPFHTGKILHPKIVIQLL